MPIYRGIHASRNNWRCQFIRDKFVDYPDTQLTKREIKARRMQVDSRLDPSGNSALSYDIYENLTRYTFSPRARARVSFSRASTITGTRAARQFIPPTNNSQHVHPR